MKPEGEKRVLVEVESDVEVWGLRGCECYGCEMVFAPIYGREPMVCLALSRRSENARSLR